MEPAVWSLRAAVTPLHVRMPPMSYPEMQCQICAPAAACEIGRDVSLMYCVLHSKWRNVNKSHVGHTMVECELNFYSQGGSGSIDLLYVSSQPPCEPPKAPQGQP